MGTLATGFWPTNDFVNGGEEFGVEFRRRPATFVPMRLLAAISFLCLVAFTATESRAAEATIIKVLPHYLDEEGRHTLGPGLLDRDTYQAQLRRTPTKIRAVRFDIKWSGRAGTQPLTLRIEARGSKAGSAPIILETAAQSGLLADWSALSLDPAAYQKLGQIEAWRATVWNGQMLLAEQKSFLW